MCPAPHTQAPAFSAAASDGRTVSLDDYRGKYLVLYFYPESFTIGCTRETIRFRDAYAEIRELGAEIVGVSRDPIDVQCKFAAHYQVSFPILSDADSRISRSYGVMFPLVPRSKRITFVIDPQGHIVARFHHELLWNRHITDVVAFLRARRSA